MTANLVKEVVAASRVSEAAVIRVLAGLEGLTADQIASTIDTAVALKQELDPPVEKVVEDETKALTEGEVPNEHTGDTGALSPDEEENPDQNEDSAG